MVPIGIKKVLAGGDGNYAYVTARVRARKPSLLPRETYSKMLLMDVSHISRLLGESQYREEMVALGAKYGGINLIEHATYRSLARNYREILGFCQGSLYSMVSRYLRRWDNWNIKTLLRGKAHGAKREDIMEDLIPAGELGEKDLKELIELQTVDEVVAWFAPTPYGPLLAEARKESSFDLPLAENALDRNYYTSLLSAVSETGGPAQAFRRYIRQEIDTVNLKVLCTLRFPYREGEGKLVPERVLQFVVPQGEELPVEECRRLASVESFAQFLQELRRYSFYPAIAQAAERAMQERTLNALLAAADRHLIKRTDRFATLYPLSILPIISFLVRKKVEVDNIRIIARLKESGFEDSDSFRERLPPGFDRDKLMDIKGLVVA